VQSLLGFELGSVSKSLSDLVLSLSNVESLLVVSLLSLRFGLLALLSGGISSDGLVNSSPLILEVSGGDSGLDKSREVLLIFLG